MTKNVLITGANRGIGFALTKHYLDSGDQVFAVCRQASNDLKQLQNINIIEGIDVTSDESLLLLNNKLTGINLDIVINNAGVMTDEELGSIKTSDLLYQFKVNAIAPLNIAQTLLEKLPAGAKLVFITSRMGSICDNTSGGYYGYRMSKTALNSAAMSLAQDLKVKEISVTMLHPGFVQTDLVNNQGNISAKESAGLLAQRIEELRLTTTGQFLHANGEALPW